MTKNKILFWIFTLFASAAVTLGICLLFLGNDDIDVSPKSVEICVIDGDYCLTTQFDSKYSYQFKLEQKVDEDFVVLNTVNSKTNSIKLADANIDLQAGDTYRFSARYINENGSGDGKFSETYTWLASWSLAKVENVVYDSQNESFSWNSVYLADLYRITLTNKDGISQIFQTTSTSFSLNQVEAGSYKFYVSACSENEYLNDSSMSDLNEVDIIRKNQISYAYYNGTLYIICTQNIEKYVVYANGAQVAVIEADEVFKQGSYYYYIFEDAGIYMQNYTSVQIKSLATEYILESDLIELS